MAFAFARGNDLRRHWFPLAVKNLDASRGGGEFQFRFGDLFDGAPEVRVWVMRVRDQLAGYFELEWRPDTSVEIAYFGLVPEFIGRGLGKHLLTRAVQEAWRLGATRVWLHTCTLDGPAALPNYVARGFTPFKTETYQATIDDPS